MKKFVLFFSVILLAACTTPKTILKNEETGQVAICGGNVSSSLAGGAIGYHIQKSSDAQCVSDYMEQGFKRIKTDENDSNTK